MPTSEEVDEKARADVIYILRKEIRLVCKHANPDDCECVWMVKPGNLEHCAELIVKQLYS